MYLLTVRKCRRCPVGGLRRLVFPHMAEKTCGCPRQLGGPLCYLDGQMAFLPHPLCRLET